MIISVISSSTLLSSFSSFSSSFMSSSFLLSSTCFSWSLSSPPLDSLFSTSALSISAVKFSSVGPIFGIFETFPYESCLILFPITEGTSIGIVCVHVKITTEPSLLGSSILYMLS